MVWAVINPNQKALLSYMLSYITKINKLNKQRYSASKVANLVLECGHPLSKLSLTVPGRDGQTQPAQ